MANSDDKMDIFVGNLPFTSTEEDLVQLFSTYGTVERAKIMLDRDTGRPRGFAFVTMPDDAQAQAAIAALAEQDFQGRMLRINPAEPREARKPGGFGGGGGGYDGKRGGGGGGGGGYDRRGGGGGYDRGRKSGGSRHRDHY